MFDEDGFYWFVGRGDDLFKIAGLWVSPIEVEAEIAKHPSVAECAVVAGENDQGKTFVRAFVVPRDDAVSRSSLEEEIRSAVKQIGGYKVPKQIEFVSELPRTELRKINRRLLREM
jgi:benzoate-CoA ligase